MMYCVVLCTAPPWSWLVTDQPGQALSFEYTCLVFLKKCTLLMISPCCNWVISQVVDDTVRYLHTAIVINVAILATSFFCPFSFINNK